MVQQNRSVLESAGLAPASIHLRLSAIRKLAAEAAENRLLDRGVAQGIVSLKGVRQSGSRAGNWLTKEQARDLLARPDPSKDNGTVRFWRCCSAVRCAGASSRRSNADTFSSATALARSLDV
jgi:hypothetical protein